MRSIFKYLNQLFSSNSFTTVFVFQSVIEGHLLFPRNKIIISSFSPRSSRSRTWTPDCFFLRRLSCPRSGRPCPRTSIQTAGTGPVVLEILSREIPSCLALIQMHYFGSRENFNFKLIQFSTLSSVSVYK